MNRDNNSYVIIYAAVMVILAAVLLAGANILLKPSQEENANIDKMEQILRALGQTPDKANVIPTYKSLIKKELMVNADGQVVSTAEGDQIGQSEAFKANTELDYKLIAKGEKRPLPVYIAEVNGKTIYVLPMNGAGLWNKIWGYIAIDAADHSSVVGADFGNAGETPGLGAEISPHISPISSRASRSSVKVSSLVSLSSRVDRSPRTRTTSMVSPVVPSPATVSTICSPPRLHPFSSFS